MSELFSRVPDEGWSRFALDVVWQSSLIGLRRTPEVAHSESITTPMVLALGRTRLLIPPADERPDSEIDWFPVFCHELAHVRRGDGWGLLVARLIAALLPWQPLVWLLRREYRRACEQACDDWAVSAGADPVQLASILTRWIPRKTPAPALGAVGRSNVRPRIERLLAHRTPPRPRAGPFWRLGSTLIALLLLAMIATAQAGKPRAKHRRKASKAAAGVTLQQSRKEALRRTGLAPYRIEPPDVISIRLETVPEGAARIARRSFRNGDYLLGPDGRVNLGEHGTLHVTGRTIPEAERALAKHLKQSLEGRFSVSVKLQASNSKVFYVINEGDGLGDQITRVPCTGKEAVADAIRQVFEGSTTGKFPRLPGKRIWIARPPRDGMGCETILPVDWEANAQGASTATNYQIMPGDRIFVAKPDQHAQRTPFTPSRKQSEELNRVLHTREEKNADLRTFACRVRLWKYDSVLGPADEARHIDEGELQFTTAGRGMFRIDGPRADKWIWGDRSIVWHDYRSKQLVQFALPRHLHGRPLDFGWFPFLLCTNAERLTRLYSMRIVTPADAEGQTWLEARPRSASKVEGFHRATLILSEDEMLPLALEILSPGGLQRRVFQFHDIVRNDPSLREAEAFRSVTPRGWTKTTLDLSKLASALPIFRAPARAGD